MTSLSPAELLQNLIRFDTTNPPGNERECIIYLNSLLDEAGCETAILASDPQRPNLLSRLKGEGKAPPLLLYGHVDVVTTAKQEWQYPPFEGKLVDGYLWGRGTLDMKGGIVMMLGAFLRAKAEGVSLPGDVVLALVSDEEAGGYCGARFLVENHASLFQGIRYAIGEFGGFSFSIGSQRFYPIMVAEKQVCHLQAVVRGPGGHGSLPGRGGTMARLARFLERLDRRVLPVHITPVTRMMFQEISSNLPFPTGMVLWQLLNPSMTDLILKLLGPKGQAFEPLFHHTVNATIVRGGEKVNVIPSEAVVDMDGRLLPGYGPEDLIAEMRRLVGNDVELEFTRHDPGPAEPDMGLFGTLRAILQEADPAGIPVPMLLPGATDGRLFSKLGIQTYGFLPMPLPPGFSFLETIHGANERIPVESLAFGVQAIYQLLQRFEDK
jgi:acetylornithine deacetylase/succinyl-diaminopimelate desuccinylase-like protein